MWKMASVIIDKGRKFSDSRFEGKIIHGRVWYNPARFRQMKMTMKLQGEQIGV